MKLLKRLVTLIAGALAVCMSLLLLAPWFINTTTIEQRVRDTITERTGRSVAYETLSIAFFPRPHLLIQGFRLSLPTTASADIASLQVYPEILPLFTGRIRLAKVSMERPAVAIDLASLHRSRPKRGPRETDGSGAADLMTALADLRSYAPDLLWTLNKGKIVLQRPSAEALTLRDLRGRFHMIPKGLDLAIGGTLDGWGNLSAEGRLEIEREKAIAFTNVNLTSGRSSISGLSARFSRPGKGRLEMRLGHATLVIDELYRQARAIEFLRSLMPPGEPPAGTITLDASSYRGPLEGPSRGTLDLRGTVKDLVLPIPALPEKLRVASGSFTTSLQSFSFTEVRIALLDTTAAGTVSGTLHLPDIRSATIEWNGIVGHRSMAWLVTKFALPPAVAIRTPLTVSRMRIQYGRGAATSLDGVLAVQQGLSIALRLRMTSDDLAVERLSIADENSSALFSFRHRPGLLDILFDGTLSKTTLDRLFVQSGYDLGSLAGSIEAHLDLSRPQLSHARGELQADRIVVPGLLPALLDVRHAALRADGDRIFVDTAEFAMNDQGFSLAGTVTMTTEGFQFDADLRSARLVIKKVLDGILPGLNSNEQGSGKARSRIRASPRFAGTLRWNADLASYGTFTVEPLQATIGFDQKGFDIQFTKARFCGIDLSGALSSTEEGFALHVRSRTAGLDLEPALACALGKDLKLSGKVDLTADLSSQGTPRSVIGGLSGTIVIQARDGEILKSTLMSRLLALLNVTDILSGEYAGKAQGGIRYRSLDIKAELREHKITIQELVMDSEVMDAAGHGSIALDDRTLDMTMLVAPVKVGNWLVKKIPLVRDVLDGTLITIPIKASGPLGDPRLVILPPSAVGEGLIGITKRTLQLPFKIIQPVLGGKPGSEQ